MVELGMGLLRKGDDNRKYHRYLWGCGRDTDGVDPKDVAFDERRRKENSLYMS